MIMEEFKDYTGNFLTKMRKNRKILAKIPNKTVHQNSWMII